MQILEHYQEKTVIYRTEPGDHESHPPPQQKDATYLYKNTYEQPLQSGAP